MREWEGGGVNLERSVRTHKDPIRCEQGLDPKMQPHFATKPLKLSYISLRLNAKSIGIENHNNTQGKWRIQL